MSYYLWIFSICLTLDKYLLLSFTCSLILSLNYYRFSNGVLFLSKWKSHPEHDVTRPSSPHLCIFDCYSFTPAKGNNFLFSTSFLPSRLVSVSRWEALSLFLRALRESRLCPLALAILVSEVTFSSPARTVRSSVAGIAVYLTYIFCNIPNRPFDHCKYLVKGCWMNEWPEVIRGHITEMRSWTIS